MLTGSYVWALQLHKYTMTVDGESLTLLIPLYEQEGKAKPEGVCNATISNTSVQAVFQGLKGSNSSFNS